MIKADYAVTFEFDEAMPITVRGTVEANEVQTLARLAVRDAKIQKPNLKWSSISMLLDRSKYTTTQTDTQTQTQDPQDTDEPARE